MTVEWDSGNPHKVINQAIVDAKEKMIGSKKLKLSYDTKTGTPQVTMDRADWIRIGKESGWLKLEIAKALKDAEYNDKEIPPKQRKYI